MRKKKDDDDTTIRRYDDTRVPYFCKSIFPLFKYGVLIAVMSAHFFTSSTDAEEPRVALVPHDFAAAWTTTPASRRRCGVPARRDDDHPATQQALFSF